MIPKIFRVFLCCLLALYSSAGEAASLQKAFWRFEFDNDYFLNKDNKLSDGIALQWHSATVSNWRERDDLLARIGAQIPGLSAPGLYDRSGLGIGQMIQTPGDLSRTSLNRQDVPYAAALTMQASWYAFNADELRAAELIAGVLGPASLGGISQKTVHRYTGNIIPKGWQHQLANEPLLGVNMMYKRRYWHGGSPEGCSWDMALGSSAAFGNLLTRGSLDIDLRVGKNMPRGFDATPDPVGLSIHYMATLPPANPQQAAWYVSAAFRASAVARYIFLDGNTFRHSYHVRKRPLLLWSFGGLHYAVKRWRLHLYAIFSTDNVYTSQLPQAEQAERGGSITLEWMY